MEGAVQSVVAAGVRVDFGEIGGRTLLWDGRRTLLRRRPTEVADGVFLFFLWLAWAGTSMVE